MEMAETLYYPVYKYRIQGQYQKRVTKLAEVYSVKKTAQQPYPSFRVLFKSHLLLEVFHGLSREKGAIDRGISVNACWTRQVRSMSHGSQFWETM